MAIKKEKLRNIFLLIANVSLSLTVFFILFHFIAKKQNKQFRYYFTNLDWDERDINDIPNKSNLNVKYSVIKGTVRTTYLVKTNSRGLRDFEYDLAKAKNTLRIAAVGDSVTYGCGINIEDTYVKQVELLLNNMCDNKVEVINFGTSGASTINELELIQKKVLSYNPDIIFLQTNPNDAEILFQIKERDLFLNDIIKKLKKSDTEIAKWLKMKLEFYKYYKYKTNLTKEEKYNNIFEPLQEIIKLCEKNNIQLVIMSYEPAYSCEEYDKVLEYIKMRGIPFLDLAKTRFHEVSYEQKYINSQTDKNGSIADDHPNEYGSKLIAEEAVKLFRNIPAFCRSCKCKEQETEHFSTLTENIIP